VQIVVVTAYIICTILLLPYRDIVNASISATGTQFWHTALFNFSPDVQMWVVTKYFCREVKLGIIVIHITHAVDCYICKKKKNWITWLICSGCAHTSSLKAVKTLICKS